MIFIPLINAVTTTFIKIVIINLKNSEANMLM